MKIVRFWNINGESYGILVGDTIHALVGDLFGEWRQGGPIASLSQVRLLPPVVPGKVVGIGLNYAGHAREAGKPMPEAPVFFFKPPTGAIGPDEAILYPPQSHKVFYEAELAVVIGRRAWRVSESNAVDHILGYTCANDVSARDIQRVEGHNTHGKAFDTFLPLGPWIVTDLDPTKLRITARVNGLQGQDSNTADMVFKPARLVSYLSHVMTLLPGDVICTGTPAGPGPLAVGDVVEIELEGIGVLRNSVVSGEWRNVAT